MVLQMKNYVKNALIKISLITSDLNFKDNFTIKITGNKRNNLSNTLNTFK